MVFRGKLRLLLTEYGLSDADISEINQGDLHWELVPLDLNDQLGICQLVLLDREGYQSWLSHHLTGEQVQELIRVSELERREDLTREPASTFPRGDYDDWTGIRPDSDWVSLVHSYRQSAKVLSTNGPIEDSAPYLYLCRHALELQLKAIIMLGQEALSLKPDLPSHHELERLWTAAFPFIDAVAVKGAGDFGAAHAVIVDYERADPKSFNFRYPVARNNQPIVHESFVLAFSREGHSMQIDDAFALLDRAVRALQLRILGRRIASAKI